MLALPAPPLVLPAATEGIRRDCWPCQHRRLCSRPPPRGYDAIVGPASTAARAPNPHRGWTTRLLALPPRPPGPRSLTEEARHVCFAVAARPPAAGPVTVDVRHVGFVLPPRPPLHRPATQRFDRWIGARHGRESAGREPISPCILANPSSCGQPPGHGPYRCARRCPGRGPGHPSRLGDNRKSSTGSAHDRPPNKALQLTRLIPLLTTSTGC